MANVQFKLARYYTTGDGKESNTAFAAIYRQVANGDITEAEARRKLDRLVFLRAPAAVPVTEQEE